MYTKIIPLICFLAVLQARLTLAIMGGQPAEVGEFPSVVALIATSSIQVDYYRVFCGGTIIDQFWVLTTGHCITLIETKNITINVSVRAGVIHIREHHPFMQSLKIVFYKKHEEYVLTHTKNKNDIGIIKVAENGFRLNRYVTIYPLYANEHEEATGSGDIAGWGVTTSDIDGPESDVQNKLTVEIIAPAKCRNLLINIYRSKSLIYTGLLNNNILCTGPITGNKAACGGDFGIPLIQKNSTGHNEVVALVSYMYAPCGAKGNPTLYTKVVNYRRWIANVMANN